MSKPRCLLIVANSGRMLAQAAYNAGFEVLVIDLFADMDTRQYAIAVTKLVSLVVSELQPAVTAFIRQYDLSAVVYGSGFECLPESLTLLFTLLPVYGNSPATFRKTQDKPVFFAALAELGITYPETSFQPPDHAQGWLCKPRQGQGGEGIRRYLTGSLVEGSVYWQKFISGNPHSVLFLADGVSAQVLGFNSQWPVNLGPAAEFVFSGIINSSDLPDSVKHKLSVWLNQLVRYFGLKGLNSLDFMQSGDCTYVLEINPRPPASMQLYDDGLVLGHIAASLGNLPRHQAKQSVVTGYQILYAQQQLRIPGQFAWPDWCRDIPAPGVLVDTGEPICSIIAHDDQTASVLAQLMLNQQVLLNHLTKV